MRDKEKQELMAFAMSLLEKPITKEKALSDLISIGLLDKEGNFTPEYKVLEEYFNR